MFEKINLFQKNKSLLFFAGMIVTGAVLFFVISPLVRLYENGKIAQTVERALSGLETDEQYLLEQARELDAGKFFDTNLRERDIKALASQVVEESRKRDLGGLLIADGNGTVLSRAKAVSQRGDFIFHTTAWGRVLAARDEVASVERGAAWPLTIMGAVPMIRDGNLFGAMVAVYIPDDEFAKQFRDRYLSSDSQIVFIPKTGVVGSSFHDTDLTQLFSIYFSPGSEFLETEGATKKISLGDNAYLIKNIILKGVEDSPGNLLVLIKPLGANATAVLLTFAIALFLAGLAGMIHIYVSSKRRHIHSILTLATGFVIAFILIFTTTSLFLRRGIISLDKPAHLIYNSTLALDPENITLSPSFEQSVAIKVRTGGEAINAAQVVLHYDPKKVRVIDIITTKSLCDQNFFLERNIDNEKGEIRIVCGLPTPGFFGPEGMVAELLIQPVAAGVFSLRFDEEETKVLANDGLGTDVLRQFTDGSYLVAQSFEKTGLLARRAIPEILIFSPTHPNQERWYNKKAIEFAWQFVYDPHDAVYRYLLDANAETIPYNGTQTEESNARVSVEKDGIYWLHILAQTKDGKQVVAHYKLKIDATPPEAPTIRTSAENVKKGEIVRFEFSSNDELSGLQRTIYIKFDEGIFFPVGPQLYTAFPEKGAQSIRIRAFDNAGNINESVKTISVK